MLTASVLRSVSNVSSWASMLNFFSNSLGTSSLSVVKELAQRLCSSWRWTPAVLYSTLAPPTEGRPRLSPGFSLGPPHGITFTLRRVYVTSRRGDSKGPRIRENSQVRLGAVCIFNFPSLLLSLLCRFVAPLNYFTAANASQSIGKKEKRKETLPLKSSVASLVCCVCLSRWTRQWVLCSHPGSDVLGCLRLSYYPRYF